MALKWNGEYAKAQGRKGAVRGVTLAAEYLLQKARERVPIQEGVLEQTGVASVDPTQVKAAVSFNTPYAVRQHEELTWRHDSGRTAKYLEGPVNEERPVMRAIIARSIRRELRS